MKKIVNISITSLMLLSGCSFNSMLEDRYKDLISIPSFNNSNNVSFETHFEVPNDGKGIDKREFYTKYSDLYDFSYVLDNINKVEDVTTKEKLTNARTYNEIKDIVDLER